MSFGKFKYNPHNSIFAIGKAMCTSAGNDRGYEQSIREREYAEKKRIRSEFWKLILVAIFIISVIFFLYYLNKYKMFGNFLGEGCTFGVIGPLWFWSSRYCIIVSIFPDTIDKEVINLSAIIQEYARNKREKSLSDLILESLFVLFDPVDAEQMKTVVQEELGDIDDDLLIDMLLFAITDIICTDNKYIIPPDITNQELILLWYTEISLYVILELGVFDPPNGLGC